MWLKVHQPHATMAAALVCASIIANLSISPDRAQYFEMDNFTAVCPLTWSFVRITNPAYSPESCALPWGIPEGQSCEVNKLLPTDSGQYWCQAQDQKTECSPAVNISVMEKGVILEIPSLPVKEKEHVTLRCSYKDAEFADPTSNFNASFFLNGSFLGWFPGGQMVLSSVTQNQHQGLYHCMHPNKVQSLQSLLIVKPNDAPSSSVPPTSPPWPKEIPLFRLLCFLALVVLYTFILGISISIYCKWTRARAKQKQQESERVSLRRIRDA
ncbi:hypothetical protein NL108_016440 [Boleophthalmus pectinirostris]|uniref:uncharacterized protein LOC129408524 n=1 Tax=Boleophthalmus pectinirostris TaxID=150288 RepID=UPI00242E194D|nr:uncharacterized protein LOC129408524 [Boleophthalmus pectinirostris]XP_055008183.1 uncharacterized protein LOC129408524 [Boleophthalmus pectinirostris]XP_055008184.1 uncharacterized protein LOC129408524 [Boleophthalmus pectinirostris]KAJ0039372.1 hypothetical protein NL108_016440 [Boleophthalmus pectinirostris]